ncbi:MAG: type II secretion system F family protein [Acidobacteriota bacterium]|nr:type II secretion system F family protein [Acidobacteriota bacterium]
MILIGFLILVTVLLAVGVIVSVLSRRSNAERRLSETVDAPVFREQQAELTEEEGTAVVVSALAAQFTRITKAVGLGDTSDVERRLGLAGFRQRSHVELFQAVRLMLPVGGALLASFLVRENTVFWTIACGVVGYLAPDFWLSGAITRRREAIRLALPDALDLLVICMEAGLGMDQALIRVGAELALSHPELSEELRQINLEQRAGTPRIEAWRHFAERTKLEMVRSFVSMLVQTDKFGTPISRSLGTFADGLRLQRQQLAEELAAKTSIKMVFPLVLFIFPSMFIVLLAPAIISIRNNMSQMFQ